MKPYAFLKSAEPPNVIGRERAIRDHARAGATIGATGLRGPIPIYERPSNGPDAKRSSRRSKIWELTAMLHCSIIGTCLTTGELRVMIRKVDPTIDVKVTDHDLHSLVVSAVGRNDGLSKRIQKALDERHRLALHQFSKADTPETLLKQWNEALIGRDIPGAYWALLTHPRATDELARHAFGDVHMLSHLVGSANRADIHKLRELQERTAELEEKLERQQERLRDGILSRDARIRELGAALSARIERESEKAERLVDPSSEITALDRLIADLGKQLDSETRRRERAERKLTELIAARAADERARMAIEGEVRDLSEELAIAESRLAALGNDQGKRRPDNENLRSRTILYVGGRPHQIARLRLLVERASGQFMHHDGGIEERDSLLAGLVSRADIAAFPVDCISHTAAQALKRLCRQAGKPFLPLRSASMSSLLQALRTAGLLQVTEFGHDQ
jgi:hypothetical protein